MMYSNRLRNSWRNLKLTNSPFSKNFINSCRSESATKKETSSVRRQLTYGEHADTLLKIGKLKFHTHSYCTCTCIYHNYRKPFTHSPFWSVSQGPPTFYATPASSTRSQWSIEGWTYEDDWDATARGLTRHTEPPRNQLQCRQNSCTYNVHACLY